MSEIWEIRRDLKDILNAKNIPSGQKLALVTNLLNDTLSQYDQDKESWKKLLNPEMHIINIQLTKEEWLNIAAKYQTTESTPSKGE